MTRMVPSTLVDIKIKPERRRLQGRAPKRWKDCLISSPEEAGLLNWKIYKPKWRQRRRPKQINSESLTKFDSDNIMRQERKNRERILHQ